MSPSVFRTRLATALLMASAVVLAGCSSDPDSGSDLPQAGTGSKPISRSAPSKVNTGTQTLGRVVDETRRRRDVIRQLDSIFKSSQP